VICAAYQTASEFLFFNIETISGLYLKSQKKRTEWNLGVHPAT
jgi:hypothetical protein